MSYVIYNIESTIMHTTRKRKERWATIAAAKAEMTRAGLSSDEFAIAETGLFYSEIEKQEVVKNMMSGKEVVQGVNTPSYLDPSSEAYWSM